MIQDLSIIIPAYNEGDRIKNTLEKLQEYLADKKAQNYEILVVNDGSTDDTLTVLKEFVSAPNFKFFSYEKNMGKGYAVRLGVENASKNLILLMDADLATSLDEIEKFVLFAQQERAIDIFIGSRKGGKNVKRTVLRRFLSWMFHTTSHLVMRIGLKDTQCGFKLFRKKATAAIFPMARMERWFLDIEILFLARKYNFKVKEIPVSWHEVGGSHIRLLSTANNMFQSIFQIKLNNLKGYYNIKEIVPSGHHNYKKILSIILLIATFAFIYNHAKISYSQVGNQLQLAKQGIQVKCIDTQIVSKNWTSVSRDSIVAQMTAIKDLGANYVAIGTPYDRPDEIKMWTEEAHRVGLHVWFRSHWLHWEGDENNLADMKPEEYIRNTSNFIKQNATIFAPEDSFTMAVEPEQAGVGEGKKFPSWDVYNQFIIDQVREANKAFSGINLDGKIHTNWISMNGWVAQNDLKKSTVDELALITVDHYPEQDPNLPPAVIASDYAKSLDDIYAKWQKPILIGEWGYNSQQEVDDYNQKIVVQAIMEEVYKKSFVVGLNYWAHMGNAARLIDDTWGTDLKYRQAALVIKDFYLQK